jgi:hypothetical protein
MQGQVNDVTSRQLAASTALGDYGYKCNDRKDIKIRRISEVLVSVLNMAHAIKQTNTQIYRF